MKQAADFQTPVPLQAAMAAFLRAGSDRKIRAARAAAVTERSSAMRPRAQAHAARGSTGGEARARIRSSGCGFPPASRAGASRRPPAARGVAVAAGQDFDPRGEDRPKVRLSASRVERKDIEPGIARLAEAVRRGRDAIERGAVGAGGVTVVEDKMANESFRLKVGLAEMLKGGVIMDVVNAEQAKIAEEAGAAAVMALERVPADIRRDGGVARMSPVSKIREIQESVSIPVMAKCRIGHIAEARVLEALKVDFIDESEVLTPADEANHVYKHDFTVPFVCGCRNLGEALRRIGEGAAMIRTKGEAGTGDIVHAVKHLREVHREIRMLTQLSKDELMAAAKKLQAPFELVVEVAEKGKTARAELRRRRHRDAGRRGALHAARRGGGLRRVRDLQVRRPGESRPRDREGDHPLEGRARAARGGGVAGLRHEGHRGGEPAGRGAAPDAGMVTREAKASRGSAGAAGPRHM